MFKQLLIFMCLTGMVNFASTKDVCPKYTSGQNAELATALRIGVRVYEILQDKKTYNQVINLGKHLLGSRDEMLTCIANRKLKGVGDEALAVVYLIEEKMRNILDIDQNEDFINAFAAFETPKKFMEIAKDPEVTQEVAKFVAIANEEVMAALSCHAKNLAPFIPQIFLLSAKFRFIPQMLQCLDQNTTPSP